MNCKYQRRSPSIRWKKLTGGTFTVDMTSLTTTDLSEYKGKLNGHLNSEDFFATENFQLLR
jgi:polyisoprenoid-binding protein YceI